jgi:hypothetical protein
MGVGELKAEIRASIKCVLDDMCLNQVREVHARLGRVIESVLDGAGDKV